MMKTSLSTVVVVGRSYAKVVIYRWADRVKDLFSHLQRNFRQFRSRPADLQNILISF